MITKGGSRRKRRWFARHLLKGKENERIRVVGVYGFGHEDVYNAFRDLEAMAMERPNCKNYFYALSLNPERGEELTGEQWQEAEAIALRGLGMEGQPYISVEHEKKGRIHRHLVISRIDADTGKVISDALTYAKHEAISREIERAFGLHVTPSVLVKDRGTQRPKRRPKDYEVFRGQRTGLDVGQVTRECTAAWLKTETGAELKAALLTSGYILCEGGRGLCIVDPAGKEHALARRIEGARTADVAERMRDIDRGMLPTVEEARAMANKWGDSEAARAVLDKQVSDVLRANAERGEAKSSPLPRWRRLQQAQLRDAELAEAHERWLREEKRADEAGGAACGNAAADDAPAFRRALSGVKPKPSGAASWRERVTCAPRELELER